MPYQPFIAQQPAKSFGDVVSLPDGNGVFFVLSNYRNDPTYSGAYIWRSDNRAVIWRGGVNFYYRCSLCLGPDGYGYVVGVQEGGAAGEQGGFAHFEPIPTFHPWAHPIPAAVAPYLLTGPQGIPGRNGLNGQDGDPGPPGPMPSDAHIAEIAWQKSKEYVYQWWNSMMTYGPGFTAVRNFVWDYAVRAMAKAGVPNLPAVNGEDKWRM